MPKARGSIFVRFSVDGRWAISLLTRGWSEDEVRGLMEGDEGARQALIDAATRATMARPDDFDTDIVEISLSKDYPDA
jgi:hypothetical protein